MSEILSTSERERLARKEKTRITLEEKQAAQEAAKKIKKQGLDHTHPLMTCKINLMEISHLMVEKVMKKKMVIVGKSEGNIEKDIQEFEKFLTSCLIEYTR